MRIISENGNHKKCNISKNDLLQQNPLFPEYQRDLMQEHVMEIVAFQQETFQKKQHYSFLNCIQFCVVAGVWFCVDGQHRYEALKVLNDIPDWCVDIEITYCKNEAEMHEIFRLLNTNTPLPQFLKLTDTPLEVALGLKKYLKITYARYISASTSPQRPYFNADLFMEGMEKRRPPHTTIKEAIEWLESENTRHYDFLTERAEINEQCKKLLQKIKEAPRTRGAAKFYLGCYWLDSIPNKVLTTTRRNCWVLWYKSKMNEGLTNGLEAPCYVCQKMITESSFEAGHIISHHNGGPNTVNNLVPVCSTCNKEVGTRNMDEFMKMI